MTVSKACEEWDNAEYYVLHKSNWYKSSVRHTGEKLYVNLFDIKDPTNCVGTFPYTMGIFLEDVEKMKKREIIFETDSDFPEGLKAALRLKNQRLSVRKREETPRKKTTSSSGQ